MSVTNVRFLRFIFAAIFISLIGAGCKSTPAGPAAATGPKGTIYMTGQIHSRTYSINLTSAGITNLFTAADAYPTPQGTFIAVTNRGLEEISSDGTTSRLIVKQDDQAPFNVTFDDAFHNPQLSPDGKYIAYEGQFTYVFDVYVVDRTTGALLLTINKAGVGYGYVRPSWTPDGRIVVAGAHNNPGLYVSDAGWTSLTRIDNNLTNPDLPMVSPDGTHIAFVLNSHIYTIAIDGTGLKQITTSSGSESWPTWSTDGNWIACYGGVNSILFLPLLAADFYNIRDISSGLNDFMTFTSTLTGQFTWR